MGLLDKFKDKAGDLVQGAKDKVSDATGLDVDSTLEAGKSAYEGVESLDSAAEKFTETKDKLAG